MAGGHQPIYIGSDEANFKDCDVCKNQNSASEAVSLCLTCTEYLCHSCDKAHRGSRLTRDHKLLTGNDIVSASSSKSTLSAMFCEDHKSMNLTLYCKSHDEVICGTCKITNHRQCYTSDVCKQGSKGEKVSSFSKTIQQLMDLESKFKDLKHTNQLNRDEMKSQLEECYKEIGQMRKKINDTLDKLEKQLLENMKDSEVSLGTEIENHDIILDNVLQQIGIQIQSLSECQKSHDDIAIFVGMKKASYLQNRYEDMISSLEKEMCQVIIHIEPDVALNEMLIQLKAMGSLAIKREKSIVQKVCASPDTNILSALRGWTMSPVKTCDIVVQHINDCAFLSDGRFVAACCQDGLRLFDRDFSLLTYLDGFFYGVKAISPKEVIATRGDKTLLCINFSSKAGMEVMREIMAPRPCYGLDVFDGEIFVTCHDAPGKGDVHILDMDGISQQRLGFTEAKYMFSFPQIIKVSSDGGKLFISDTGTHFVTCLSRQGHVLYKYSDKELESPLGIYVDGRDNILVFGKDSYNIHVVQKNGKKETILRLSQYGIQEPQCIAYRQSTGFLVVSQATAKLHIFSMKHL